MVPYAGHLASGDPEPAGAYASFIIFGAGGGLVGSITYWLTTRLLRRIPSNLSAALTGGFCGLIFFATLGLMHVGIGFYATLGIAFALLLLVAFVVPVCMARKIMA
jgi:hypothetical protein